MQGRFVGWSMLQHSPNDKMRNHGQARPDGGRFRTTCHFPWTDAHGCDGPSVWNSPQFRVGNSQ